MDELILRLLVVDAIISVEPKFVIVPVLEKKVEVLRLFVIFIEVVSITEAPNDETLISGDANMFVYI